MIKDSGAGMKVLVMNKETVRDHNTTSTVSLPTYIPSDCVPGTLTYPVVKSLYTLYSEVERYNGLSVADLGTPDLHYS